MNLLTYNYFEWKSQRNRSVWLLATLAWISTGVGNYFAFYQKLPLKFLKWVGNKNHSMIFLYTWHNFLLSRITMLLYISVYREFIKRAIVFRSISEACLNITSEYYNNIYLTFICYCASSGYFSMPRESRLRCSLLLLFLRRFDPLISAKWLELTLSQIPGGCINSLMISGEGERGGVVKTNSF